MAKTSTNISLDPELKRSSQELFADLGSPFACRACLSSSPGKIPTRRRLQL